MIQIDCNKVLKSIALAVTCLVWVHVASRAAAAENTQLIARGEYLAKAGDCISCHTAPRGKPFVGGLYMPTPFGDISTPNITPDRATGIGNWSDEEFYRALHEGIGKDHEYLYPVFPFPWYTKVTREDILAIKAYLFSLAAEVAPRKPLKLTFPFNIRDSLLAWRTIFFKPGEFAPNPHLSAEVNRGAYLVEGLGHCGECHNHNKIFGASDWSGRLQGGQIEGWYAPNITSDGREGVGSWSNDKLDTFLKTGMATGEGVALGPMRETIDNSLRYLSDQDVRAMSTYLKSVTGGENPKSTAEVAPQQTSSIGSSTYLSFCAYCHLPDGHGVTGMIPPLAGNSVLTAQGPENVIRVVLGGLEASHGLAPMPAVGVEMTDQQVAEVVNFVRTGWGNDAPMNADAGMVAELRTDTRTLLAGNLAGGCPSIADPKLAQSIEESGARGQLQGASPANLLEQIDTIIPRVKASGLTDDEIVNAMAAAYCQVVAANTSPTERAALLGNFDVLVYGQIKKAAKND